MRDALPWVATVFAATYAAFYSRFASQWEYAAQLYNAIKATECDKSTDCGALAAWKAGFLEDCDDLHLAKKGSFATTIYAWGNEQKVQTLFIKHAIGAKDRLATLLCQAAQIVDRPIPQISCPEDRQPIDTDA